MGILGYVETYYFTKDQSKADAIICLNCLNTVLHHRISVLLISIFVMCHQPGQQPLVCLKYEYTREKVYFNSALKFFNDFIKLALNEESVLKDDGTVELGNSETILNNTTLKNNSKAIEQHKWLTTA